MSTTTKPNIATALKLVHVIANGSYSENRATIEDLTDAARAIAANDLRSEIDSLTHDLKIAANSYDQCAKDLSEGGDQFRTAVFTFERQSVRARAMVAALEAIEEF